MNKNDIIIRLEEKEDYRNTETLVRNSFWNVYRPGCLEHYVLHTMRDFDGFVPELDFIMEKDGEPIGQIAFVNAQIVTDGGNIIPVMAVGPLCIKPELQRKGYGKLLLDYALDKAFELGCKAVCLEGNFEFYSKCGFTHASDYAIRYQDLGTDDASFFLCRELQAGYLKNAAGVYAPVQCYFVDEAEAEAFDKGFEPKEKLILDSQIF